MHTGPIPRRFETAQAHAQHLFLVYESLERGSLSKILNIKEEAKELDWQKRLKTIKGIAHAYLTCIMIVHQQLYVGTDQARVTFKILALLSFSL